MDTIEIVKSDVNLNLVRALFETFKEELTYMTPEHAEVYLSNIFKDKLKFEVEVTTRPIRLTFEGMDENDVYHDIVMSFASIDYKNTKLVASYASGTKN